MKSNSSTKSLLHTKLISDNKVNETYAVINHDLHPPNVRTSTTRLTSPNVPLTSSGGPMTSSSSPHARITQSATPKSSLHRIRNFRKYISKSTNDENDDEDNRKENHVYENFASDQGNDRPTDPSYTAIPLENDDLTMNVVTWTDFSKTDGVRIGNPDPHWDSAMTALAAIGGSLLLVLVTLGLLRLHKRRRRKSDLWITLGPAAVTSYYPADDVASGIDLDEFIRPPSEDCPRPHVVSYESRCFVNQVSQCTSSDHSSSASSSESVNSWSPECISFYSLPLVHTLTSSVTSFRAPAGSTSDSCSFLSMNRTLSVKSNETFYSIQSDDTYRTA